MESIDLFVNRVISEYFKTLGIVGYLNDDETLKILILEFIQDLLSDKYYDFLDQDSYNIIINAVYNLSCGSCIIDTPYLPTYDQLYQEIKSEFIPRKTENNYIRITENNSIREKA